MPPPRLRCLRPRRSRRTGRLRHARHRDPAGRRAPGVHDAAPRPPLGHGRRRPASSRRGRPLSPGRGHRRRRGDGLGRARAPLGRAAGSRSTSSSPLLRDREVEITTWCSGVAAIAAGRRWSVTGDAGGRVEVDSVWIHLGPDQRPARIGDFGPYAAVGGGPLGLDEARAARPARRSRPRAVGAPLDRPRRARPRQQRRLLAGASRTGAARDGSEPRVAATGPSSTTATRSTSATTSSSPSSMRRRAVPCVASAFVVGEPRQGRLRSAPSSTV